MRIALATLCLNEQEFLEQSYAQHKDWPGLCSWAFVEGADRKYGEASPSLVSFDGLSVDNTSDILKRLAKADERVTYVPYGWMEDVNSAQNKTKGRDRYLDVFENVSPDFFIVLDADEFYTREDQQAINELLQATQEHYLCWRLTQRHIWSPPSLRGRDKFGLEVVGGYWAVRHVRVFRWRSGIRYQIDHNWPMSRYYRPLKHCYDGSTTDPQCIHLGFARSLKERVATNRYYKQRGEGRNDGRHRYVSCRGAWEGWRHGSILPYGAQVIRYSGPIPECYEQPALKT